MFVGHAVGSIVGMPAANREPERFARLVLIGPSPRYIDEPPDYLGGFARADIEGLRATMHGASSACFQTLRTRSSRWDARSS